MIVHVGAGMCMYSQVVKHSVCIMASLGHASMYMHIYDVCVRVRVHILCVTCTITNYEQAHNISLWINNSQ